MNRELIKYGIHNEASNIRAHVAPLACCVFVFPTVCGKKATKNKPIVKGYQPGFDFPTSEGFLVSPNEIEYLRTIKIHPSRFAGFDEHLTTTEKGNKAVELVECMLKAGKFPLWMEGEFITDSNIQTKGTDLIVKGNWRIEVKCDFRASFEKGKPNPKCTGNLYLQDAECNPGKFI